MSRSYGRTAFDCVISAVHLAEASAAWRTILPLVRSWSTDYLTGLEVDDASSARHAGSCQDDLVALQEPVPVGAWYVPDMLVPETDPV